MEEMTQRQGRQRPPRQATSLRFGEAAQVLASRARAQGWSCPAFRSPPALVGVNRSIRRRRDGKATVAVALRGRPWAAVLADMIEGVVAANRLGGVLADRCRTTLWAGLSEVGDVDEVRRDDETETQGNGQKAPGFAA